MVPVVLEWGDFVIPTFGLFMALGYLVFGFVFWRRLKGDYDEERILSLSLLIGIAGLICARLVFVFGDFGHFGWQVVRWLSLVAYPGLSIYGAMIGGLISAFFLAGREWRTGEVWDATVVSGFSMALIVGVGALVGGGEVSRLYVLLLTIWTFVVLLLTRTILMRYRSFRWYRSGKVGFVGWSGFLVFNLGHLVVERMGGGRLYWGMTMGGYINVGLVALSVMAIYHLSGRRLSQDLGGWRGKLGLFRKQGGV